MNQSKSTTTNKTSSRATIDKYLSYKGYDYPSFEDFQVWCIDNKIMSLNETKMGDYKGVLYIYSKRHLTNLIASGERGAANLVIMLRELEAQMERETRDTNDMISPVQLVIDFKSEPRGERERKKIKP